MEANQGFCLISSLTGRLSKHTAEVPISRTPTQHRRTEPSTQQVSLPAASLRLILVGSAGLDYVDFSILRE